MRKLKKAFSLTLALALSLALAVPAFADGSPYTFKNKHVQITNVISDTEEGTSYSVYEITCVAPAEVSTIAALLETRGSTSEDFADGWDLEIQNYEEFENPPFVPPFVRVGATYELSEPGVYYVFTTSQSVPYTPVDTCHFKITVVAAGTSDPKPTDPVTPPAAPAAANPTNDSLTADGALQTPTVYKINGSNYFKIRDLAAILNGTGKQFSVGYDGTKNAVTATTGQGYARQPGDLAGAPAGGSQTADPSNDAIYVDGQKITAEVYKINGSNYFKLRDLGKALDFYVGWSADRGVYIETDKPYSE